MDTQLHETVCTNKQSSDILSPNYQRPLPTEAIQMPQNHVFPTEKQQRSM